MPCWDDEESLDEDICMVSMDQQLFDEGVNCGVVEWVDGPWLEILQRCLGRIWDMYEEQNLGRVKDEQAHEKEAINKNKKELEDRTRIEISMEKLKLAKEQRCILQIQADIIQNMRKAMKEVQVDRDLLKEEEKKLEYLIADLLKAGHCTKDKLERIKAIVDE
ncbi:hypothetical protein D1007_48383 [Hordeum vulgare]|nr:hypothetical protein D1007_48383 [Hordeum vulgare]